MSYQAILQRSMEMQRAPQRASRGESTENRQRCLLQHLSAKPPPQKKSGAEGRGTGAQTSCPSIGSCLILEASVLDPPGLGGCLVAFVLLFLSVVPAIGRVMPEFQLLQTELLFLVSSVVKYLIEKL